MSLEGPFVNLRVYGISANVCNYCDLKQNGRWSFKCHVQENNLTPRNYMNLLDRGWRRSGTLLYQPSNDIACCPQYGIRVEANKYVQTKKHKKVLKRFERFLKFGTKEEEGSNGNKPSPTMNPSMEKKQREKRKWSEVDSLVGKMLLSQEGLEFKAKLQAHIIAVLEEVSEPEIISCFENIVLVSKTKKFGDVYCNTLLRLKSVLKRKKGIDLDVCALAERVREKLREDLPRIVKSIECHNNGLINFFLNYTEPVLENTGRGRSPVDKSKGSEVGAHAHSHNSHAFSLSIKRAYYCEEAFQVYKKYQIAIHKDDESRLTPKQYTNFLVNSPFTPPSTDEQCGRISYGTFHHEYRIDGKIVAVGVIDLVPSAMSSVYLFYDPDFSFLSLGVYSALKEIEWVKSMGTVDDEMKYYYLGYYIHSCPKMNYKRQFRPSELLCPITYQWVDFDAAIKFLDKSKYCCLVDPEMTDVKREESRKAVIVGGRQKCVVYLGKNVYVRCESLKSKEAFMQVVEDYVFAMGVDLACSVFAIDLTR
eukprot:Nk52_evm37s151 gene=Nk52_evmTU37s151